MRFLLLLSVQISLLFFVLPGSGSLCAEPAAAFTAAEKSRIESGEVVVRFDKSADSTGAFLISGYVNASPEKVWDIITDYSHFRQLYPELLAHDLRSRSGQIEEYYSLFDYPWPLEDRWLLTRIVHDRPNWYIRWTRIDGTVKESTGSWKLYGEGQRTLIVYQVRIDPGLKFVPDWFVQWGTRTMAPKIILRIRDAARSR